MTSAVPVAPPVATAPACLYCGCGDLLPLYDRVRDRLGFVPGERTFLQCRRCGSALLVPQPATAELPGFYPPVYSFTQELGGRSPLKRALSWAEYHLFFGPQYAAQTRNVMRACGWRRGDGKRLLDVGCGAGLRLLRFRRLGFAVHGLDVQPEMVRYLRNDLGIPATCADVSALAGVAAPGSFDLVTSFFLVEHIPDVRRMLAAAFDLLKPGGWMTATVPFVDCVQARVFGRRWIHTAEAPRHLSLPTRRGLTGACRAAGFEHISLVPDSALNCAGQIGSSLIPGATVTHLYGKGGWRPLVGRAVGAAVTFAAVPWCLFENHVLGRVSMGMVVARKPPEPGGPPPC